MMLLFKLVAVLVIILFAAFWFPKARPLVIRASWVLGAAILVTAAAVGAARLFAVVMG